MVSVGVLVLVFGVINESKNAFVIEFEGSAVGTNGGALEATLKTHGLVHFGGQVLGAAAVADPIGVAEGSGTGFAVFGSALGATVNGAGSLFGPGYGGGPVAEADQVDEVGTGEEVARVVLLPVCCGGGGTGHAGGWGRSLGLCSAST